MKYFDSKNNRLVFESEKATPDFWDKLWRNEDRELKKIIERGKKDYFVSRITKKYIKPTKEKKILEGGCGMGTYVFSLDYSNYDVRGIDFATKTVAKVNKLFPNLKISDGDVENLNFPDNFFDGYWSLGVIEHFYEGYSKITKEMERVVKNNGYLFITFPCLSSFRKIKARLGKYKEFSEQSFNKEKFYQFALDPQKVKLDIEKLNFKLIKKEPLDGIKGLKDEISILKPLLQKIYNSNFLPTRIFGAIISKISSPIFNHSILLVFKKNE